MRYKAKEDTVQEKPGIRFGVLPFLGIQIQMHVHTYEYEISIGIPYRPTFQ